MSSPAFLSVEPELTMEEADMACAKYRDMLDTGMVFGGNARFDEGWWSNFYPILVSLCLCFRSLY
jgi:hypothetical protein